MARPNQRSEPDSPVVVDKLLPGSAVTRLAAVVEYDGEHYHGWQTQANAASVQATLERALARVADHPITLHAAGRTDAGVHATGQVVHFDTSAERPPHGWMLGANVHLADDISVCRVQPVPDDFHARFSAMGRHYRYVIHNARARSALRAARTCWFHYPLDVERMQRAARALIGEHDFSSFRAAECQARSPMREVRALSLWRQADLVIMDIEANAFLHHMVRNIAGVLLAVGRGIRETAWVDEVLRARNRSAGGVTAPAGGLYLRRVDYPARFDLACHEDGPALVL